MASSEFRTYLDLRSLIKETIFIEHLVYDLMLLKTVAGRVLVLNIELVRIIFTSVSTTFNPIFWPRAFPLHAVRAHWPSVKPQYVTESDSSAGCVVP